MGQHILFLGQYKFDQINPTDLVAYPYEMRISLIFPFLCAPGAPLPKPTLCIRCRLRRIRFSR